MVKLGVARLGSVASAQPSVVKGVPDRCGGGKKPFVTRHQIHDVSDPMAHIELGPRASKYRHDGASTGQESALSAWVHAVAYHDKLSGDKRLDLGLDRGRLRLKRYIFLRSGCGTRARSPCSS